MLSCLIKLGVGAANHDGIIKKRVAFIIQLLEYRKICVEWVPHRLTDKSKQRRMQQLLRRSHEEEDEFL